MQLEYQGISILKIFYQKILNDIRNIVREEMEKQSRIERFDETLNQKDMARLLNMSTVTLRKYEEHGLPVVREFGRDPRYNKREVMEFFERNNKRIS